MTSTRLIYPARRAVEHAAAVPGVRPLRLFPVLWPLWQVETTASVYDEQAYELVDRFLMRAVVEAGLSTVDDVARFLGVPADLVQRCATFLSTLRHLTLDAGTIRMTELGLRSAREGIRYAPIESRQTLLIERLASRPLPRGYHKGSLAILPTIDVPDDALSDRSRFLPVAAALTPFRPDVVQQLAQRPDRAEHHLPKQLRDLRVEQHEDGFLPMYLIESAGGRVLAYTALAAERDVFFEDLCSAVPLVRHLIANEERLDPRQIWTAWLASGQYGRGTLEQRANGVWRVTLRADAFGPAPKLPISKLGSFELRKGHFLQLWCADAALRQRALLERAVGVVRTPEVRSITDLEQWVAAQAERLDVAAPSVANVRAHAQRHHRHAALAKLDELE